jgi:hypothetical protein
VWNGARAEWPRDDFPIREAFYELGRKEEVSVVVTVAITGRRAMGGGPFDAEPGFAEAANFTREVVACVKSAHALDRDEVVVPTDLVAALLNAMKCFDEVRSAPVFRGAQNVVRGSKTTVALESGEVARTVESLIDIVPEPNDCTARVDLSLELAQRNDHKA